MTVLAQALPRQAQGVGEQIAGRAQEKVPGGVRSRAEITTSNQAS